MFAFIARFTIGIGSAFCFLSCIWLASRWFSEKKMTIVTSILVSMATTGGLVAQKPAMELVMRYGWRNMLLIDALLGVFIMTWVWLFVCNYPFGSLEYVEINQENLRASGFFKCTRKSYFNLKNWIFGLYTSLLNFPFWTLGASWGIPFLIQTAHFSARTASDITSMLFVGIIFGGPFFGWISDRVGKRKLIMYIGALTSSILLLLVFYTNYLNILDLKILFFLIGFFTSTQIISYPIVAENNPKSLTATSVSVISFLTIGGGVIFQSLFGSIMNIFTNTKIIDSMPMYTGKAYFTSLIMLPICAFISFILVIFMRETRVSASCCQDESSISF